MKSGRGSMRQMDHDRLLITKNMPCARREESSVLYTAKNASGGGDIRSYEALPGVYVNYNDFHMEAFDSRYASVGGLLCIDHCREGRMEWEGADGYFYIGAGDVYIDDRKNHTGRFGFPLRCYRGVTVCFEAEVAARSLRAAAPGFDVDLGALMKGLFAGGAVFLRSDAPLQRFFAALYDIPPQLHPRYLRVKALELLVLLDALRLPAQGAKRAYFNRAVVDKVKAAKAFLVENISKRPTLQQLSGRFSIPLTTLKSCFKAVYGSPVYSFMRALRMNMAAAALAHTQKSVTEIAAELGYDNESKFAAAFKSVMGATPSRYRKTGGGAGQTERL